MRKRIYIAGPITKGDTGANAKQGTRAAVELIRRGYAPFCPQLSVFMGFHEQKFQYSCDVQVSPCDIAHAEWLEADLPWVAVSDGVLRLPGESVGADVEVQFAEDNGIPVFRTIEEIHFDDPPPAAPAAVLPFIKDSGVREAFSTGSVRDTRHGKGRFDLITPIALRRLALHYEGGAAKYGDRNWEKGQPLARYLDSALRHINCHQAGERDEDHLIAAAWNLFAYVHTEEQVRRGNLPKELAA